MKSVIKKATIGAAAILATLSSTGVAAAAPAPDISSLATCGAFVDKDTDAGSMHIKRCTAANNEIRFYGWIQKYTDDASCVTFRFRSFPENYSQTWSVCKPLEYANIDTAYRKIPATWTTIVPN